MTADTASQGAKTDQILREPEVSKISGLSRVTRWRLERAGQFPRRVKLSAGRVGWRRSEVERWMANLGD